LRETAQVSGSVHAKSDGQKVKIEAGGGLWKIAKIF